MLCYLSFSLTSCHYKNVPSLGCFGLRNPNFPQGYEDPTILAAETIFSVSEVEALHELFKKLSNALIEDGLLHKEEFQLALFQNSKRQSLFADRVFTLFDLKKNGVIGFGEFVRSLSVFHPKTPLSEKIDFTFRLYDLRQNGFIEREEVEEMLVALLLEAEIELSEDAISAIIDKTFNEADTNKDGRIDREEWRSFVLKYPALMKITTLSYLQDVTTLYPSFIFNSEVKDIEKHQGRRNRRHVSDMEG